MEVIRHIEARFLKPGDKIVYKRVIQERMEEGVQTFTRTIKSIEFKYESVTDDITFEEPEDKVLNVKPAELLEIQFDWTWAFYQMSCEWSHLRQLSYTDFVEELRNYAWEDKGCIVQQIKSDMELSNFHSELLDHLCCGGRYCPSCVTILKEELDYQRLIQRF